MASSYPSVINDFNVYKNGVKLIGVTGEVTLPDFETKTSTINGAGILGDIEESILGQFNSIKQEITFRTLTDDIFSVMNPLEPIDITLRGAIQTVELSTGVTKFEGIRVVMRGKLVTFKPGAVKQGEQMGSSVNLELTYIMIEVDNNKKIELDKLNGVYIVNGVDLLGQIKSLC